MRLSGERLAFGVVTTCFNPGGLLAETVESVLRQRAVIENRVDLDYVIVDAGSTDGTVEYLDSIEAPGVRWLSESDAGMYDGLSKGFDLLEATYHAYINAGDLYHPHAFDLVADLMPRTNGWLTGMDVRYNDRGDVIYANTPFRFRSRWLEGGAYDGGVRGFLQQESTFWRSELTQRLDLDRLREFQLAGDAYLWSVFATHADLAIVSAHLGGFRLHGSHLSDDARAYRAEMRRMLGRRPLSSLLLGPIDRALSYAPLQLKKKLNPHGLLVWRDGGWA